MRMRIGVDRLIARLAMAFSGDVPHWDAMAAMLGEWWAKKDAEQIAYKLTAIAFDIDLFETDEKRRKAAESKQQTLASGEKVIRDWLPSPRVVRQAHERMTWRPGRSADAMELEFLLAA